jgi:hypothetical protein
MNEDNPPAQLRMKRIQKVSRVLRILCGIAFVLCSLIAIASLFAPITKPTRMDIRWGNQETSTAQKESQKASGEPVTDVKTVRVRFSIGDDEYANPPIEEKIKPGFQWIARPLVFGAVLFWSAGIAVLYRLFKLYEQGMIFTPANVRCIKWLGLWALSGWALSNVVQISKFITYNSADVDLGLTSTFFAGVLVLLMSWIMEEGGKIQEEHSLTI